MHISLLPWNRGSAPNLWSFWEDTPKGVTIHEMDAGIDTGPIIAQKELFFDEEKETFSSTYNILQKEIVELFKECWGDISNGNYTTFSPNSKGTYHDKKDLSHLLEGKTVDYDEKIASWKQRWKSA